MSTERQILCDIDSRSRQGHADEIGPGEGPPPRGRAAHAGLCPESGRADGLVPDRRDHRPPGRARGGALRKPGARLRLPARAARYGARRAPGRRGLCRLQGDHPDPLRRCAPAAGLDGPRPDGAPSCFRCGHHGADDPSRRSLRLRPDRQGRRGKRAGDRGAPRRHGGAERRSGRSTRGSTAPRTRSFSRR